jgi:hypothetical protein
MPKVLVIYLNVVIAGVLGPGVGCPHRFAVYWSFLQWNFHLCQKEQKKKLKRFLRCYYQLPILKLSGAVCPSSVKLLGIFFLTSII